MFREIVKEYRSSEQRVKVDLVTGRWVEGVIINHGPEAILVETSPSVRWCIMKQAIVSISPAVRRQREH